jgi:hypothetical protein
MYQYLITPYLLCGWKYIIAQLIALHISNFRILYEFMSYTEIVLRLPAGTRELFLLQSVQARPGSNPSSHSLDTVTLSPGVKQQGCEFDHSPPTSTEIKQDWRYSSTPSHASRADTDTLLLTYRSVLIRYAVAQWLRYCATNGKVAVSIPVGVIGIFYWYNPSDRTMALGWTQLLTEMSTRSISWGYRQQVRKADKLTTILCSCHAIWEP